MEHKLSKLTQLREVTLTDEERAYLRGRMAQLVTEPAPVADSLFQRGMQHGLRIALSSLVFVVFVGGSISAVASNALPGDPLYSFKVNVNEEIKYAFLTTPEEKVAYQKSRVEKRVGEIKTLAETKTLTKEKQARAQKALDSNIEDLSTQLSALSDQSPNTALSVTAHLEESLKANKAALQTTLAASGDSDASGTIETIDGTIKKVSQQEVKIISKELDNIAGEIDNTPTPSTDAAAGIDTSTQGSGASASFGEVLGESTSTTATTAGNSSAPITNTPVSP